MCLYPKKMDLINGEEEKEGKAEIDRERGGGSEGGRGREGKEVRGSGKLEVNIVQLF